MEICINGQKQQKRELEIYVHIPFCVKKCAYCDFLSGPATKEEQEAYVEALLKEIAEFGQAEGERSEKPDAMKCREAKNAGADIVKLSDYTVVSVFFGGGTPSILEAEQIGKILTLLKERFEFQKDVEISIECNPGTANQQKLEAYRAYGINRISFGLQSADNEELKLLGRIHTWEQFLETYRAARKAGFSYIYVDLMSSLPGLSVDSWKETLEKVLELEPEHISAYSLIIEEGTTFYERYEADARLREEGEVPKYLPSEDAEREMYRLTEVMLQRAGMKRYEISNYAKEGYECRHYVGYWIGTEYVGFGLGASSYLRKEKLETWETTAGLLEREGTAVLKSEADASWRDGKSAVKKEYKDSFCAAMKRVQNTPVIQKYLDNNFEREIEELSQNDQMAEFMFLGLRMMCGVEEAEFQRRFEQDIDAVYGAVLEEQCRLGLLERNDGWIRLTPKGVDLSNMVMAEFLL